MNLRNKKILAVKTLGVGKDRIIFDNAHLTEIKEAITKEDIRNLFSEGVITIKPEKGRRTHKKRKTRRGLGKIKIKVKHRKQDYVKLTRKLRGYLKSLRKKGKLSNEVYYDVRKKIKMKYFKSKANLKEYLLSLNKDILENASFDSTESKDSKNPSKPVNKQVKSNKTEKKKA